MARLRVNVDAIDNVVRDGERIAVELRSGEIIACVVVVCENASWSDIEVVACVRRAEYEEGC